jgi:medium-chain acyl-[acyl-carrier-protein] hydrolase
MTGDPTPSRHRDDVSDPTSRWFVRLRARPEARLRLVCFTSAGAGASSYARWPEHLPPDIEPWAVQLPGRETRRLEQPISNLDEIVGRVVERIQPLLDVPFAFFGHSMGALAAFEVVRRLARTDKKAAMLFVSGRVAPHLRGEPEDLDELSDDEFIAVMDRRYGGIPSLLREDLEFRELYLPPLRADAVAVSRYAYVEGPPLDCPIFALGGVDDRSVPRDALDAWERHTRGDFRVQVFPGDHFYLQTARSALVTLISTGLARRNGRASRMGPRE